ncbi:MAG: ethanolamine ammonia-lyase subunit EutC [Chloroflexi bacterium]|nr:ethanolamine ammonia-lyase subunit EutC [Chloroflexota bacterium]
MDEAQLNAIIEAVVKELAAAKVATPPASAETAPPVAASPSRQPSAASLNIDLPDPTLPEHRYKPRVKNPKDADAVKALIASTTSRIGVGRAGPHYNTFSLLLFQGDHAITQDALMRDVDQKLLDDLGLFTVQTNITGGKQEYLLRPDLGRQLSDEAKKAISEKCAKSPNIQLVVGDGLSAAAVEANAREMFPVIMQGAKSAGLTVGTPFFIKYCRVGVLNDIGDLLKPDVVILLIGERPGLGRAESLSAYMAYRPKGGDTDADRDVVCNIFNNGGTNPLEGAAFTIQIAQKMIKHQASGVKLKLAAK